MELFLNHLFQRALGKNISYSAVIQVGSNAQLNFSKEHINIDSDIDMIVITDSESYQTKVTFEGKIFDISFINANNCLQLIDSALNGSPFAGKLFSASTNYNILIDENSIGENFIMLANYIYDLYKVAARPNHNFISLSINNINANKSDLTDEETFENHFVKQRLFNHLTDYISALVYPFSTSGKYRGEVFKKFNFNFFKSDIDSRSDFITHFISEYEPIYNTTDTSYIGLVYNDLIEKQIIEGSLDDFFFGYDNVVEENLIIFINKNTFSSFLENNDYQIVDINNSIPTFNKKESTEYFGRLSILSSTYFDKPIELRLNVFYSILSQIDVNLQKVFQKSIKAIIVQKTCKKLVLEKTYVKFDDFRKWILGFQFKIEPNMITTMTDVNKALELFDFEDKNPNSKEEQIKNNYVLFGIMKALRINIEHLELI